MRKTMNKQLTEKERKARLNSNYKEWTKEDYQHTIKHAYSLFRIYQEEKGNSKQTLDDYERAYKRLAKITEDGELPVKVMTQFGFQMLFIKSLGDVGQQTINHYLRHVRSMGNYWESIGLIDGFEWPIKEIEPEVKDVYTDAEIKKLIVRPKTMRFEEFRNWCIILLFLSTGARCKTVLDLRVRDVDLESGYINFNSLKNHSVIQLKLDKKCWDALEEYIDYYGFEKSDWLFPDRFGDKQLTRNGLYQAIANYNRRRGVEKTGLHLFRHYYAKTWIMNGGDIISLAKVLTHKELDMVKKYSNLYSTDLGDKMKEYSAISVLRTHSGKTLNSRRKDK